MEETGKKLSRRQVYLSVAMTLNVDTFLKHERETFSVLLASSTKWWYRYKTE